MKKIILIILILYSASVLPVEFYQCIDSEGRSHFTNLPKFSLDKNCTQRGDQYLVMLRQDYSNLANELKKYEVDSNAEGFTGLEQETEKNVILDILDADIALEQLLENTQESRQNTATDFFKARSEAVEKILESERPIPDEKTIEPNEPN